MDEELKSTLLRVVPIAFVIPIPFIVCKFKKFPFRETLALKWPPVKQILIWLCIYAVFAIINEFYYLQSEAFRSRAWDFELPVVIIRSIGIIVLAPVAEELIFRGLLFNRLSRLRTGEIGAVIITTVFFAAAHYQYGLSDMLYIVYLGLLLGIVRWRTGSVFLTITMHMIANTISVVEFLVA